MKDRTSALGAAVEKRPQKAFVAIFPLISSGTDYSMCANFGLLVRLEG